MPDEETIIEFVDKVCDEISDWCRVKAEEWNAESVFDFSCMLQRRVQVELSAMLDDPGLKERKLKAMFEAVKAQPDLTSTPGIKNSLEAALEAAERTI